MSNRKKVARLYHVRYVADFLVPALSTKEAFDLADEEMTEMVEGDEMELDDIFDISIENDKFHVVEVIEVPDDEDEEDDEDDEGEDEDEEDEE